MINHKEYEESLKKLGKYKTAGGCIYVNKLEDIDLKILSKMFDAALEQGKSQ